MSAKTAMHMLQGAANVRCLNWYVGFFPSNEAVKSIYYADFWRSYTMSVSLKLSAASVHCKLNTLISVFILILYEKC